LVAQHSYIAVLPVAGKRSPVIDTEAQEAEQSHAFHLREPRRLPVGVSPSQSNAHNALASCPCWLAGAVLRCGSEIVPAPLLPPAPAVQVGGEVDSY
jgi:hypothetical protein